MPSKGLNARGAQKTFWPLAVPEIGPHPIIEIPALILHQKDSPPPKKERYIRNNQEISSW